MKTNMILVFALLMITACGKKGDGTGTTPGLTFDNITLQEGTTGVNYARVKLKLSQATSRQVSVTYSTSEISARAGSDFIAETNQTVVFQPNETEKDALVSIVADDIREADETFTVTVQNAQNVNLLKSSVIVTLTNDDTKVPFSNTGPDAPTSYPGYTLAWSDEFNGTSLNSNDWGYESGDGCPGLCGWGNNELEYYTAPPNNIMFQDGKMIIEARSETFGGKNYTSARIKTQGKKMFKFGRVDIRAILPKGKGIWPAFWLLPQDNVFGGWPRSGEIDMMEYVGSEPAKVLGTLHYGPGPNSTYISRNYFLTDGTNFNDKFHVYSLEWKQDQIKWYVDDVLYSTINKADIGANNWPFNELFFFIINLAVGGNLPGSPDASTTFPQWLIVDYIRIYQ
jgi:beta-glucanase (GH16 family)